MTADGAELSVEGRAGLTLMEVARAAGVPGNLAECGGACSCSTCHVLVDKAWDGRLPPMAEDDADFVDFAFEPDPETSRLSCQIKLTADLDGLRVTMPAQRM